MRGALTWTAALSALLIAVPAATSATAATADQPWLDSSLAPETRAQLVLDEMTLEQKIALIEPYGDPHPIPELGLPAIRYVDGCCSIGDKAGVQETTVFPAGLSLASSFDTDLAYRYGEAQGDEAFLLGGNSVGAPTMEIMRSPWQGRTNEGFGEDPLLSGLIAAGQVNGIQSDEGVLAVVKHYGMYDQEARRVSVDEQVDDRTLQEVYNRNWEKMIDVSDPGSVMCAFSKTNGVAACNNEQLLTDTLRNRLGFEGFVTSDYNACVAITAYEAGADWCSPFNTWDSAELAAAVQDGTVPAAAIDRAVYNVLVAFFKHGLVDNPVPGAFVDPAPATDALPSALLDENETIAEEVAIKGSVLLRNEEGALPLDSDSLDSIAVIGADADFNISGNNGFAASPARLTTIVDGITEAAGDGVTVTHVDGTDPVGLAGTLPGLEPVPSSVLSTPDGSADGVLAQYFANPVFAGDPFATQVEPQVEQRAGLSAGPNNRSQVTPIPIPAVLNPAASMRWDTVLTPTQTGDYELGLDLLGSATLSVDGQAVVVADADTFATQSVTLPLVAGESYDIRIDYRADAPNQAGQFNEAALAMIRFGWTPPSTLANPGIVEAAVAAKAADVAVVVVRDYAGEGADRGTLTLPQAQDRLIEAVAAVNDRTIVVMATGGPVLTPWINDVDAVLESWYPGEAQGKAVAKLLFGDATPTGKLPFTWPSTEEQPAEIGTTTPFAQINIENPVDTHDEGILIGYRGYLANDVEPQFPFGFGLSYPSFEYGPTVTASSVDVAGTDPVATMASVTVKNTGETAGTETVQLYTGALPTDVPTAERSLAGFAQVNLAAGESKTVEITLDRRALQYWDATAQDWVTPAGDVALFAGSSVADTPSTGSVSIGAADTTAPTVTITADPATPTGSNGWYRDPVQLTVTAEDAEGPVASLEASIDGGAFAPVTGPIAIEADGEHTVAARAVDQAGNSSETATWTGKIDRTAPTVAAEKRSGYRLVLTANDETSGVDVIRYRYVLKYSGRTVNGPWLEYKRAVPISDGKILKVEYRATDEAGNRSASGIYRK
ncbi:glycoside hydrolase family 3 [Rathayibacter caricis DSM 15933]|uniref:Glycoside hydrolase family 3 n=2 Tax=Rathayibacter caricis TaxID=110936 RepID=A0A2T4UNU6_9MICO|nr:glycoside hydrolase family 3 [Rathayibacter caricis DSM 15933]